MTEDDGFYSPPVPEGQQGGHSAVLSPSDVLSGAEMSGLIGATKQQANAWGLLERDLRSHVRELEVQVMLLHYKVYRLREEEMCRRLGLSPSGK